MWLKWEDTTLNLRLSRCSLQAWSSDCWWNIYKHFWLERLRLTIAPPTLNKLHLWSFCGLDCWSGPFCLILATQSDTNSFVNQTPYYIHLAWQTQIYFCEALVETDSFLHHRIWTLQSGLFRVTWQDTISIGAKYVVHYIMVPPKKWSKLNRHFSWWEGGVWETTL